MAHSLHPSSNAFCARRFQKIILRTRAPFFWTVFSESQGTSQNFPRCFKHLTLRLITSYREDTLRPGRGVPVIFLKAHLVDAR